MTRLFLALVLALAAPLALPQDYPQREIRSLCNFGPGSGADILVVESDPLPGSPEQIQDLLKTDSARWKGYVELAKIQPQ